MSTLHLVNRSASLTYCVRGATRGDAVVFYERGVLACTTLALTSWLDDLEGVELYALASDVAAASAATRLHPDVVPLSDEGFVDLVVRHGKTVSWS